MKPFQFQQFSIHQSEEVFRVGTDAVLLGALANVDDISNALEIGCGTGIISLMIAQRNLSVKIKALDIDENAVQIAKQNFTKSPFSERLSVSHEDFKIWNTDERFDFVFSNPPYFEENSSQKDVLARQKIALDFDHILNKSSEILSGEGRLSVIIPSESSEEFVSTAKNYHLNLSRKINIFGIEKGILKRNILELSRKQQPLTELNFYIEKSPRKYSDQYLEATKDFHVFGK